MDLSTAWPKVVSQHALRLRVEYDMKAYAAAQTSLKGIPPKNAVEVDTALVEWAQDRQAEAGSPAGTTNELTAVSHFDNLQGETEVP